MHNYMLSDLSGSFGALALFSIFLFMPGYVIGWAANLFSFREKQLAERILFSVPLSISFTCVTAVLLARFTSLDAAVWVFLGLAGVFAGSILYEARFHPQRLRIRLDRPTAILLIAMAAWAVLALGILLDIQIGHRLYPSVPAYDHCIRTAFTRSALETGVPPANPFFFFGHAVPLRYYYYWNLLSALPAKLGGLDPRLSLYASCVWAGFGLASIIPLYFKYFMEELDQLRAKSLWGVALLAVTGLDLIPIAVYLLGPSHLVLPEMEWWNSEQITAWVDALLWVPHHIAALVACLLGFLALWRVPAGGPARERIKAAALASFAFASAGGLSVYVSFTFGIFLLAWTLLLLCERRWAEWLLFAAAGAGAILLSLPYLKDLQSPGSPGEFAAWSLRWRLGSYLNIAGIHSNLAQTAVSLLAMPFWYLLELGFFFVAGLVRLRQNLLQRRTLPRHEIATWLMLGTSLFIASFLRSMVITNNDLGMRSALLMQFVLLLWAAPLAHGLWSGASQGEFRALVRPLVRPALLGWMLAFGAAATVYQAGMLRAYPLVHVDRPGHRDPSVPSADKAGMVYGIREAYDIIDRTLPARAIVQYNPVSRTYFPFPLYSNRHAVEGLAGCGSAFGGHLYQCLQIQPKLKAPFNGVKGNDGMEEGGPSLDALCDQFSIDALMATIQDPVWRRPDSWVWKRPAFIANPFVRVFRCGSRK